MLQKVQTYLDLSMRSVAKALKGFTHFGTVMNSTGPVFSASGIGKVQIGSRISRYVNVEATCYGVSHYSGEYRTMGTLIGCLHVVPPANRQGTDGRRLGKNETVKTLLPLYGRNTSACIPRSFASADRGAPLAEALDYEIEHERTNYKQPEELLGGPPAPFTLTESKGDTLMTLTRSYGTETLSVDVMVNDQPDEEPFENEEGEMDVDVSVEFVVTCSKGKGQDLVFECKSDGSYLDIIHVALEEEGDDEDIDDAFYTGPDFEELDESLQDSFLSFLEERGITAELGEWLMHLVHDKEQREYMYWLEKVKHFVSS
eukprot:jgi/Picsp_1/3666/NSC_06503-R1_protein